MLIDTRTPPPAGDRAAWEPNWRLWTWVALTIGAFVAADATAGLVAYLLVCAGLAFACRAIVTVTPSLDGLREYRQ
jgi:hypothetical protein